MRSPSIEWLHAKLERHIKLVQSYTEVEAMEFIIKACRLKPYSYIFEGRDNKLILHRWWFDEFGNSLKIIKNKNIHVIYNDLKLDRKKIVSTDLYYGLSLDKIAKMSKLIYLVAGKDEDLYEDCFLLTFLGIDNHLRSYLYWYGEWQQVSPLLLETKHLKIIFSHLDLNGYHQMGLKENFPIPCILGQAWLSCLPVDQEFLDVVKKHYEILLPILDSTHENT